MKYKASSRRLQADGSNKPLEYTKVFAIDSHGRWIVSRTIAPSSEQESPTTKVCVYDSVAGIRTTRSVPGKQATQTRIVKLESGRSCENKKAIESEISRLKPVVEDLGTNMIHGYEARGFKTSRTIPIDANGNDRGTVRSVEVWRAAIPGPNSFMEVI